MKVFVLNCGSSSVKYKLFDMSAGEPEPVLASGRVERIGAEDAIIVHKAGDEEFRSVRPVYEHRDAIGLVLRLMEESGVTGQSGTVDAVGHRVVHGGELFREAVLVTDEVRQSLVDISDLAPLHNPHNVAGIDACAQLLPGVPQVAVFDTALHSSMPPYAYLYGLPYELYERLRIRRYGFHGISHKYVAERVAALMNRPLESLRIISCHPGQRRQRHRRQERPLRGHVHGLHAAGRPDDGHPLGRHRRGRGHLPLGP
jgi:Acetate kinase